MLELYGMKAPPPEDLYGESDFDTVKAPYKPPKDAPAKPKGPQPLGGDQSVSATTVAFVTGVSILVVVGAAWFFMSGKKGG